MATDEVIGEGWAIGELAAASGLTVRTLHHYDRLGLLVPSQRTAGGHRRYSHGDVAALYRIVALRQLDLSLAEIGAAVSQARPVVELLRRQLDDTAAEIDARQERLTQLKRCLAAAEHAEGVGSHDLLQVIAETVGADPEPADFAGYRPDTASGSAVLSSIFEGVTPSHGAVRSLLPRLDQQDLALGAGEQASGGGIERYHGGVSVGGGLVHVVVFEDDYVNHVLQSRRAVWERCERSASIGAGELSAYRSCTNRAVRSPLPDSFNKTAFQDYMETVFSATFDYVTNASDAELNRDIPGPGKHALGWSMKVSELLAQVAAHTFSHSAEIGTLVNLLRSTTASPSAGSAESHA